MGRGDPLRRDTRVREARDAQHGRIPGALLSGPAPLWPSRSGAAAFDVFAIGQISLDRVSLASESEVRLSTGGQVAGVALALARLGCRVAYQGAVGDDAAADAALAPLRAAGVDCTRVRRVAGGRTRGARIRISADGEREIEPERDPGVALTPEDLDAEALCASRVLHVDAEDPAASLQAAALAGAAGAAVVLDADAPFEGWPELVERVDFPIVSRPFAEAISKGSAREGLLALAARARRLAVVTLGAGGALACAAGSTRVWASRAIRVEVRDTTGAGDAFHAGFIWGLLQGFEAERCVRVGHAVAALNCAAFGAQGGLPDRGALEAFLAAPPEARGETR